MKVNYLAIIFAAIASFLLLDKCTENKPSDDVKIVRDTIVQLDTQIVRGKPKIIEQWRDTGSIIVDTVQVLQDWSTTYVYADSVRDGLASIDIIDTISRNTIQGRSIRYVLPTTTITETRNPRQYRTSYARNKAQSPCPMSATSRKLSPPQYFWGNAPPMPVRPRNPVCSPFQPPWSFWPHRS